MDLMELGLERARSLVDPTRLRAVEPTEREALQELDAWLWGGERLVDVEELRRPDAWLTEDYSEVRRKES